ncbi:DUF1800 family protein [Gaetbulibacter aestuarii]|uniref:DUF1800 family protein n=1 Tax=Gaetbulibacter aestuarii TaxID=1502358 RepID=A0ABW7MV52_9FLAO
MPSILPLSTTLDFRKAKHLLRRATWVYNIDEINALVGKTASEAVDLLLSYTDQTLRAPFNPKAGHNAEGYFLDDPVRTEKGDNDRGYITGWWLYNATRFPSLKYKMSFFLHTSFSMEKRVGGSRPIRYYDHLRLLDYYALGNIKIFATKMTLDPAMLDYLSNDQNDAGSPNENYAREFMELFTIMKGPQIGPENYTNYTESDVQEAARLLTGYGIDGGRTTFDPDTGIRCGKRLTNKHDFGNKTFSAAFNNQTILGADRQGKSYQELEAEMKRELDDFVDMIFSQRETARAYARKLYRFFVKSHWNDDVERDIIEPLADEFIDNDFEVVPALKKLLSSAHFYDADNDDATDEIIGCMIKSPLQLILEIMSVFKCDVPNAVPPEPAGDNYTEEELQECLNWTYGFAFKFLYRSVFQSIGFDLFDPDSVAGYPAYYQQPDYDRLWFDSSTIIARYKLVSAFLTGDDNIGDGRSASFIPRLDPVSYVEDNCANPSDPNSLIVELSDLLYPESIDTDRVNYFKSYLVDEGFQDYYWTSAWTAYKVDPSEDSVVRNRLNALVTAMVNAPEFQTM